MTAWQKLLRAFEDYRTSVRQPNPSTPERDYVAQAAAERLRGAALRFAAAEVGKDISELRRHGATAKDTGDMNYAMHLLYDMSVAADGGDSE